MVMPTTEIRGTSGQELRSLAPDMPMPEILNRLTRFGNFAVTVSEDGSSCTVGRLEKIDQVGGGNRITEKVDLSADEARIADAWITEANQNINGKVTQYQLHQLGVVGDVLRGVMGEIERTGTSLPPKPAV